MIRRRRLVRLHLEGENPSLEGLLVSPAFAGWLDHHYVLELATMHVSGDESYELSGRRCRVPRERVVFVQELREK